MDRRVERTELNSLALVFWSRLMTFSFMERSRSMLKPSLSLSRMSKVMSMASSVAVLSVGGGASGAIMGFLSWGGAGGGTGRDGGMLTGAGCWTACAWVLVPSYLSGITIICLPLLWKRSGEMNAMRLMVLRPYSRALMRKRRLRKMVISGPSTLAS